MVGLPAALPLSMRHSGASPARSLISSGNVLTSRDASIAVSSRPLPVEAPCLLSLSRSRPQTLAQGNAFSDSPPGVSGQSYPLYFYLHSASSRPLTAFSHLLLSEALEDALRTSEAQATPMRNGSILVRASSRSQSQILTSLSHLGEIPIVSKPDDVRNTSKGTIYAPDFSSDSSEAILAHLRKRNVPISDVYRFPPRKENPSTPNPRLLLTFSVPFPPTNVKLGFTKHTVRTYVPFPRRCFKCQKFGHPQKYCRSLQAICPRCGSSLHLSCEKHPPCCPNCKGPHSASSAECPSFILEKEILELNALQKLDRREVTRRARDKLSLPFSYAAVANPSAAAPSTSRHPHKNSSLQGALLISTASISKATAPVQSNHTSVI